MRPARITLVNHAVVAVLCSGLFSCSEARMWQFLQSLNPARNDDIWLLNSIHGKQNTFPVDGEYTSHSRSTTSPLAILRINKLGGRKRFCVLPSLSDREKSPMFCAIGRAMTLSRSSSSQPAQQDHQQWQCHQSIDQSQLLSTANQRWVHQTHHLELLFSADQF